MIWYILTKYQKAEKDNMNSFKGTKLKPIVLITYMLFFVILAALNFYAIVKNSFIYSSIAGFSQMIAGFIFIHIINKKTSDEIDNDLKIYYLKLGLLRDILRELKLYSGKKNKQMIEMISDQKEQWRFSVGVKKVLSVVTTSFLIPIVTLIYKWLFDNVKPIDQIIIYIGLTITTILVILGIAFMIVPFFINKIDKEYKEFNRLQSMLEDINLIDFVGENVD